MTFTSRPSETPRARTCDGCHGVIVVAYCDALPWVLDCRDHTPAEEAAAILDGRHTFGVYGRPGSGWLKWRLPERLVPAGLPRLGAKAILIEHKCGGLR